MLVIVVAIGLYLPLHHSGSIDTMFHSVQNAHPGMLALSSGSYNTGWFISSIVLSALGFFMWPHYFGAVYASKNSKTFRRNAMLLPLYQLVLLFVFFIGFTALLVVPGLAGATCRCSRSRSPRSRRGSSAPPGCAAPWCRERFC